MDSEFVDLWMNAMLFPCIAGIMIAGMVFNLPHFNMMLIIFMLILLKIEFNLMRIKEKGLIIEVKK